MLISNTCSLTEDFHWVTSLEKDICSFKWPTIIREHVLYKVSKSRLELHFLSEITTGLPTVHVAPHIMGVWPRITAPLFFSTVGQI